GLSWRQSAQDDLPLLWANFSAPSNNNGAVALGPGNRADLLVRAPAQAGIYTLNATARTAGQATPVALATVQVANDGLRHALGGRQADVRVFDSPALYPPMPASLKDIEGSEIGASRNAMFVNSGVASGADSPMMTLAAAEEWRVSNSTSLAR